EPEHKPDHDPGHKPEHKPDHDPAHKPGPDAGCGGEEGGGACQPPPGEIASGSAPVRWAGHDVGQVTQPSADAGRVMAAAWPEQLSPVGAGLAGRDESL